jgi:hypothetical protein
MNMGSHAPATQGSRLCSTNQSLCCASWGMHPDCKTLKTPRSLSRQRNDSVAKSDGEVENNNATIVSLLFTPCITAKVWHSSLIHVSLQLFNVHIQASPPSPRFQKWIPWRLCPSLSSLRWSEKGLSDLAFIDDRYRRADGQLVSFFDWVVNMRAWS